MDHNNDKKELILIGEKKSENLGDSLICAVASHLFSEFHPKYDIRLYDISIARRPDSKLGYLLNRVFTKIIKQNKFFYYSYSYLYFFYRIPNKSHVCIVGGALLQDFFSEALVAILDVCRMKRAILHFSGIGIGNLSDGNKEKIRRALIRVKKVDLKFRDGLDVFSMEDKIKCSFVPDMGICCCHLYGDRTTTELDRSKAERSGGGLIGFGVIHPEHICDKNYQVSMEYYIQESCRCINSLIALGERIAIFTNGDSADFKVAEMIFEFFHHSDKVQLINRPTKVYELIESFKNFKYVISSRLHSLIISFSFQISTIAIACDNKMKYFEQKCAGISLVINVNRMHTIKWETEISRLNDFSFNVDNLKELQAQVICNIKNIT